MLLNVIEQMCLNALNRSRGSSTKNAKAAKIGAQRMLVFSRRSQPNALGFSQETPRAIELLSDHVRQF